MTQPTYEYARQLNRQKSMPNTTQSQSSSSVASVTQSLPFLNNISPLDPLPTIPTAATPMIQLPDGTHIALEDLMELIIASTSTQSSGMDAQFVEETSSFFMDFTAPTSSTS